MQQVLQFQAYNMRTFYTKSNSTKLQFITFFFIKYLVFIKLRINSFKIYKCKLKKSYYIYFIFILRQKSFKINQRKRGCKSILQEIEKKGEIWNETFLRDRTIVCFRRRFWNLKKTYLGDLGPPKFEHCQTSTGRLPNFEWPKFERCSLSLYLSVHPPPCVCEWLYYIECCRSMNRLPVLISAAFKLWQPLLERALPSNTYHSTLPFFTRVCSASGVKRTRPSRTRFRIGNLPN